MNTMMLALALAASVAGCKKKEGSGNTAGSAVAPTATGSAAMGASAGSAAASAGSAAAPASGDLPTECNDYKAAVDALAKCDKLPSATRDAFKQSYDQMAASAANIPPEGKAGLGTSCKNASDAMKQSTASYCP